MTLTGMTKAKLPNGAIAPIGKIKATSSGKLAVQVSGQRFWLADLIPVDLKPGDRVMVYHKDRLTPATFIRVMAAGMVITQSHPTHQLGDRCQIQLDGGEMVYVSVNDLRFY
ncbi:MAG: hypothetical protein SFT94_05880 [Pseudanabaenaceae cyanobacterium bins.68]|nr:hypothetical protein [Pseudanabaenaceae cyanobacterium bins.68]